MELRRATLHPPFAHARERRYTSVR